MSSGSVQDPNFEEKLIAAGEELSIDEPNRPM